MKTVSVLIPCYNEVENVAAISEAVSCEMEKLSDHLDYEIVFIDNHSSDGTREELRRLCSENKKIKAILNAANFGQFNSPFYGLRQVNGDCAILLCADFQDPVETIPELICEWENGAKVVCAIKEESDENRLLRFFRTCYYKLIGKLSDVPQIEHFTGFGLYDRSFLDVLKRIDDPTPFLRGIVAEYAPDHATVSYRQAKRREGKTHNNFWSLYDGAMLSMTTYTSAVVRVATVVGIVGFFISITLACVSLVLCIVRQVPFSVEGCAFALIAALISGLFFYSGLLGEYVLSISRRTTGRPLVVEEDRLV